MPDWLTVKRCIATVDYARDFLEIFGRHIDRGFVAGRVNCDFRLARRSFSVLASRRLCSAAQ